MKQAISKDRIELSDLLSQLVKAPQDGTKRTHAVRLALRIALQEGDQSASRLMESLALDASPNGSKPNDLQALHTRATARAARRAIAAANAQLKMSPKLLAERTVADPESLCALIRMRLEVGQLQVASCIAKVGISRHPENLTLREIQEEIGCRLEEKMLPAPIPFPVKHH